MPSVTRKSFSAAASLCICFAIVSAFPANAQQSNSTQRPMSTQRPTRWVTARNSDAHAEQYSLGESTPVDPRHVVGNQACVKCHAAEINVWRATPHAMTFDQLHRRPEAQSIASKLGLNSIKHSGRCVACHYTQKTAGSANANSGNVDVIAGVSCESCHGAAKAWLDLHQDYGGKTVTRDTESAAHRAERIARSIHAGMRNPTNVYLVAQSCLRCHTTADEELVNLGGHSPGSLNFEFVSWSQGTIRHNFLGSEGTVNATRSPAQLRVMFVAGMIAELEAALRATAVATEKAKFGVTVAQRAHRSIKRLQSVAAKIDDPRLKEILDIAVTVPLKLNHQAPLQEAADKIAALGLRFADRADGETFAALDPYIPSGRK